MNIYLQGYDYKHDIFEILRVILDTDDIKFIDDKNSKKYEDRLEIQTRGDEVHSEIYKGDRLIKDSIEPINLDYIDIYNRGRLENNARKRSLYKLLVEDEKLLPWGILTGIRPLKLIHGLMDRGLDLNRSKEILKKEYLISNSKLELMEEIISNQRKHIYPLDNKKYSLYVNIPFCPSRCYYCSFSSYSFENDSEKVREYLKVLQYELKETAKLVKDKKINTVYIGGGTPTHLRTVDLEDIIITIKKEFNIRENLEFTVEAGRPDTITKDKLLMMKKHGVNRISINPQTMNTDTLIRIGRRHNEKSIISKFHLAKAIGFDIINMDVILGLPGEDINDIKNTLDQISKLDPDNLTIHSLAIKRGSELARENNIEMEDIDEEALGKLIDKYIKNQKMYPYYLYRQKQSYTSLQNIGYSKKDKESIYNILMMEEKQTVVGVGLGAVTKIFDADTGKVKRIPNFKGLADYINRVNENLYSKNIIKNLK